MFVLENEIKPYAWGSRTAFSELFDLANPNAEPQAELWMGAHPLGPSRLASGAADTTLLDLIAREPEAVLGAGVRGSFGDRLPFLLKALAADAPLSIQAHPNPEQARRGYEADDAAGIPLDAPQRNYRDRSHKPELLCALTRFEALCGFRTPRESLLLVSELGVPELTSLTVPLRSSPDADGLRGVLSLLFSEGTQRPALVEAVVSACAKVGPRSVRYARELAWGGALAARYPGDVGCVLALLLNLVVLKPGEAIFLPAGNLHSYLGGTGVEIMANSDNVLRAGLTPKHVNPSELLRIVDFRPGPVELVEPTLRGEATTGAVEVVYSTPASEFELSRLELDGGSWRPQSRRGPEIVFCTRGEFELGVAGQRVTLERGRSALFLAADSIYEVAGAGRLFRAQVGAVNTT
jgi:mannose-6-phosphate isomerase